MAAKFKKGDHVEWNSEAGVIKGIVVRRYTKKVEWRGRIRHATPSEPQYELVSDRTGVHAMHKESALRKVR